MISASTAGRYPVRSRFGPAPARQRRPLAPRRLSLAAVLLSAVGHAVLGLGLAALVVWDAAHPSKVYVVNLVPTVAAVGHPDAPAPSPSLPARSAPSPPARISTPDPTPEPRPVRELPRLPETSVPSPRLPPRPAPVRAGEKELPALSGPAAPQRVERAEKVERPVESRPGPVASLGLPSGSAAGAGALSLDASDFPHAWYLRQVLQKVQGEWQRQNQRSDPGQKPLVFVEIQRDGSIRTPKIEQSSGNPLYDQAALRAIVDASPFPPLPPDWSRASLRVMFRFDLERGRG